MPQRKCALFPHAWWTRCENEKTVVGFPHISLQATGAMNCSHCQPWARHPYLGLASKRWNPSSLRIRSIFGEWISLEDWALFKWRGFGFWRDIGISMQMTLNFNSWLMKARLSQFYKLLQLIVAFHFHRGHRLSWPFLMQVEAFLNWSHFFSVGVRLASKESKSSLVKVT